MIDASVVISPTISSSKGGDLMSGYLTSIELFAGGGGMALGTRLAGFSHLALIEWNKSAAAILRHNAARHPHLWVADRVYEKDVRVWLTTTAIKRSDNVDLIAGGPPCQPFSLAGIHAGDTDARNMFPAAIEVVRKLRPRYVIFENVPGLTRPSFAPYFEYIKRQLEKPDVLAENGELWTDHDTRLKRSGSQDQQYVVYEQLLDAADFGLAQNRRRVFLVAIRSDVPGAGSWVAPVSSHSRDALLYDQWVSGSYWEEHGLRAPEQPDGVETRVSSLKKAGRPPARRWQTIRDCVSDLPSPIDGVSCAEITNHEGIPGARIYAKHSGSAFDWPAKTIKAGVHGVSGGEAMIRFGDGSLRYFTVREAARMQGFRDDYEFPGSRSRSMGAIGNAVAVPVARLLAEHLRKLTMPEPPIVEPDKLTLAAAWEDGSAEIAS